MKYFDNVYKGRRVLVTGHTGFKGSWLSLWLLSLGAEVAGYSLDIPSTPSNFVLLDLENRIQHYFGDIRDSNHLNKVIDEFKPEIIFHLAAQALVRTSYLDPTTTFETNVLGMVNILDAIRKRPWIEVAVLITSDKVYKNNEWCWGYRETDAVGGYDPYSASKGCADLIAQSYFHSFLKDSNVRVAIARAGNVIGGGDWAIDRIVPDCIRAWSKGEQVVVRNPQATRPWQHVLEPLSGYLWLGSKLWNKADHINGEAFNFGPDQYSNNSVAELLDAMALRWKDVAKWQDNSDSKNKHEAKLLKLSCDKAQAHLNWRPVMQFGDTIEFTVDWYSCWYAGNKDFYGYMLEQIKNYCNLASVKGLSWIN